MAKIYGQESAYIKKIRRDARVYGGIFILLGLVISLVYLFNLKYFLNGSIYVLIGTPMVFFLLVKILDDGIISKEKTYHRADHGFMGEDAIYHELNKLPDSYAVFRGGLKFKENLDVDFIVVGPTGVFSVEVKSHMGKIAFSGSKLTINGYKFKEKDVLRQAMGEAMDVHFYLKEKLGRDQYVVPLIVFSSLGVFVHFGMKKVSGVHVIGKKWLLDIIESNTHGVLDAQDEIEEQLKSLVSNTV